MRLKDIIFSNIYKKPAAFGLDISDFSIKIIQLEQKRKGIKLKSLNRTHIPKGIIEQGEIKKEQELIKILKKSITEIKGAPIRTSYAICSLPEQHAFIKVIKLPKMKLSEAKEAIKWEAEANIPLSIEEVYLDWQIIHSKKDSDHTNILVNAVPKELADKYLQVLTSANIEPVVFEIESVASVRSLIKNGIAPKPVLIIDLGFSRTSFIIFAEKDIRFTSSISVSNQEMIYNIAKNLKVDQEQAQLLKFKYGLSKEKDNVFKALVPSIDKLIDKVKDCIAFYKEEDISKIILCGGGAYLKGLPEYVSVKSKIPVELGNPLVNIPSKESLAYSTALGLALRGIDVKL